MEGTILLNKSMCGLIPLANWYAVGHCIRFHDLDNISLRAGQYYRTF